MTRAGVFIGVDRTGNLQELRDAAAGARRMYEWALAQGMTDQTHAKLVTDAGGAKVTPDMIYDAIKAIIDGPGVDQLIVYFAGHGVNINRSEHWLLSDAPVRTGAAVNVRGSVDLATYCGIAHIVLISDACRVAPDGIQAQNVRGQDIFPNDAASDRTRPVDQFFACALGKTAAELKDAGAAAGNFSALYTNAMLDALKGGRADVLEPMDAAAANALCVRPRKLASYLELEVPRRVKAMNLEKKVNQNPDAIITSDGGWVARIDAPPAPPPAAEPSAEDAEPAAPGRSGSRRIRGAPRRSAPAARVEMPPPAEPPRPNVRSLSAELLHTAASGDTAALSTRLETARAASTGATSALATAVEHIATPFGPDHVDGSDCGVKVRGAKITEFFAAGVRITPVGSSGQVLGVTNLDGPAVSILLGFDRGDSALVPVIRGFLAALTFDDDELVDVAYEPSADTWRWDMFRDRASEVRALRAVAASAAQHGRFRLEGDDAMRVAQRMQYAKGIDPTLAIYAAYAYHDRHDVARITQMSGYLRSDIGVTLFDLALLGKELTGKQTDASSPIVPFVPLLSQGWALLNSNRVTLHPTIAKLEERMRESLWSLYDDKGAKMLREALSSGDVR